MLKLKYGGVKKRLKYKGLRVVIYEPTLKTNDFEGYEVISDYAAFKKTSDVIVANRYDVSLDDVHYKVYQEIFLEEIN